MLNAQVAQTIVNRTMSVLNVNVNIMDVTGRVIAAGNRERIGSYHSAAAEVIATGKKKTVSASEAAMMDGVQPGITLPIIYKDIILGALGMTGEPELVEKYGELVVLTALLIIEQEEMKDRFYQEQRARESLLVDLFTGRCLDDPAIFRHRAELLGVPLDQPWMVSVAKLVALEEHGQDTLLIQHRRASLSDHLAKMRLRGYGVEVCFLDGVAAFLYPAAQDMPRSCQVEDAQYLHTFLHEETGASVLLSVSGICLGWKDIPAAFVRASDILETAQICGRADGVVFFEDFLTEHVLRQIPDQTQSIFCAAVLGGLYTSREEQRMQLLETLNCYYGNDMNAQKTADALFLHRNTLNMRLNKIRDLTGYAPQRFRDALVLRMALVLSGMGGKNL